MTAAERKQQNETEQQLLAQLLLENEYQQQRLARTMAASQTKQAAQLRLSVLADHFGSTKSGKPKTPKSNARTKSLKPFISPPPTTPPPSANNKSNNKSSNSNKSSSNRQSKSCTGSAAFQGFCWCSNSK